MGADLGNIEGEIGRTGGAHPETPMALAVLVGE
jgi:hypothetical protein